MLNDAQIVSKRDYPSPNPSIVLTEITYISGGLKVKGMLAEPKKDGKYEGIIYLRGGIQHIGMARPARIAQFASQGFVVFAPYYRGNRGGEGRDEFAGDDILDAVHAVDIVKQSSKWREGRIHLFSFSRGGIMALWTAILREDITSTVHWAGVSDVVFTYNEREDMRRMMKRVIGGSPNSAPEAYRERTALFRIEEISAPVLIIHGMKDENVSFEQAILLEDALREAQKAYETWYFKEYTHHFPSWHNAQIVRDLTRWMSEQP